MLVSIVIGALNEEAYIGRTIESAKRQKTRHKYEVIVGDGYSTDRTVEIAKGLGAKIALERNHSAAWERQAGAKIVEGDVIAFTDADVEVPEDWVETIGNAFEKDPGLVMLYGPVCFSDTGRFEREFSRLAMHSFLSFMSVFGAHNPIGSNMVVRRASFERIGGLNTGLVTAEDLDLAKRMKKEGKVRFSGRLVMNVSARRVKKWGLLRFLVFHLINGFRYQLSGKAEGKYDAVR